jgi:hypothetical protein
VPLCSPVCLTRTTVRQTDGFCESLIKREGQRSLFNRFNKNRGNDACVQEQRLYAKRKVSTFQQEGDVERSWDSPNTSC